MFHETLLRPPGEHGRSAPRSTVRSTERAIHDILAVRTSRAHRAEAKCHEWHRCRKASFWPWPRGSKRVGAGHTAISFSKGSPAPEATRNLGPWRLENPLQRRGRRLEQAAAVATELIIGTRRLATAGDARRAVALRPDGRRSFTEGIEPKSVASRLARCDVESPQPRRTR